MDKDDICVINFALVWTIFCTNILVWLCGNDLYFKATLIVEIFTIPILYLLGYVIGKLIDKNIL